MVNIPIYKDYVATDLDENTINTLQLIMKLEFFEIEKGKQAEIIMNTDNPNKTHPVYKDVKAKVVAKRLSVMCPDYKITIPCAMMISALSNTLSEAIILLADLLKASVANDMKVLTTALAPTVWNKWPNVKDSIFKTIWDSQKIGSKNSVDFPSYWYQIITQSTLPKFYIFDITKDMFDNNNQPIDNLVSTLQNAIDTMYPFYNKVVFINDDKDEYAVLYNSEFIVNIHGKEILNEISILNKIRKETKGGLKPLSYFAK